VVVSCVATVSSPARGSFHATVLHVYSQQKFVRGHGAVAFQCCTCSISVRSISMHMCCTCMYNNSVFVGMVLSHASAARVQLVFEKLPCNCALLVCTTTAFS
jgi:hypothetical protein